MPRSAFEELIADAAMQAEAVSSVPEGARAVLAKIDTLYTIDPSTLGGGGAAGPVNYASGATGSISRTLESKGGEVVSVRDFGAVGDGATNDRLAFQNAIDYLKLSSAPTRRLIVPWTPNGYLIHGRVDPTGCHGLTIEGDGTKLTGTGPNDPPLGTWGGGAQLSQDVPCRFLTGRYRPGDTTVTLSGTGEANSQVPVVGDWVLIKTGDLIGDEPNVLFSPLCEFNQVAAISGNTVTLRYPLCHFYSYMGDGHTYGMAVVSHLVTTDLTVRGLHFHHAANRGANMLACIRLRVENCHFTGAGALHMRGRFMHADITTDITPAWPNWRPYHLAVDVGSSDFYGKVQGVSKGVGIVHLHEGLANGEIVVNVTNGKTDTGTTEQWAACSLLAYCRNVTVRGRICNSPKGPAVESKVVAAYSGWGNFNCTIDVAVEGEVTADGVEPARAVDHNGAFGPSSSGSPSQHQEPLVVRNIDYGAAKVKTAGFGSGAVALDKLTKPLSVTGVPGASPTQTTEDGETVFSCADGAAQGVDFQEDIPAGGWTHAVVTFEIENVDAAAGGDVVWQWRYRFNTAGAGVDYTGDPDVTQVQTLRDAGATHFARGHAALGSSGRFGFRLIRNGGGASDTLAGAVKLRRAWITYYRAVDPAAASPGGKWSATLEIDSPQAGTAYTILTDHDEPLKVTAAVQQSVGASAGTLDFRSNSTTIAGLGTVAVSTTKSTTAPTSGVQVIPAGARVDVVPTGITGVTRLTLTLRGTK